jgi:hypothetical protein
VIATYAWNHLVERDLRRQVGDDSGLTDLAARDDLLGRFDALARQELLDRAMTLVRRQADPLAWHAFELTSQEHRSGVEVAQTLGQTPSWVYQARSRIRRQIQQTMRALDRLP